MAEIPALAPVEQAVADERQQQVRQALTQLFEDAVQIACAITQGLEAIWTRDRQGFASSIIPVLSVRQLLEQLEETDT